jgi:hypothetical protein
MAHTEHRNSCDEFVDIASKALRHAETAIENARSEAQGIPGNGKTLDAYRERLDTIRQVRKILG